MAQVLAGSLVFLLLTPDPLLTSLTPASAAEPASWASLGVGALAAGLVFFGLDALIGPTLMHLKYGLSWREVLAEVVLPALPSDALAMATVLVTVPVTAFRGPLAAVILLSSTFFTSLAMARVREHRKKGLRLEAENAALKDALRDSNAELASRLICRLGSRDGYAASYAAASAGYARDVAREMGLGEARSQEARLAAANGRWASVDPRRSSSDPPRKKSTPWARCA